MTPTRLEVVGSIMFVLAVAHTFLVDLFHDAANRFPLHSFRRRSLTLLGEVEAVFGSWAAAFFITFVFIKGPTEAIHFVESLKFTEPVFVFVVMATAATLPVRTLARSAIRFIARILPFHRSLGEFFCILILGPLAGSLITEPAAMTISAILLKENFFSPKTSDSFKYACLGLLFVNVSIGGTLTHFAAPPVVMVAKAFGWDTGFMLTHFGWKAIIAIVIGTTLTAWKFKTDILKININEEEFESPCPPWVILVHLLFLVSFIFVAHHPVMTLGLFLYFVGFVQVSLKYQEEIKFRESLMVAFFLAGLVVLGSQQSWWLKPLFEKLSAFYIYSGATVLTSFTDNSALTYLGSLVPGLSDASKYALVAGSVVGGGLTLIANAPNPAGFAILGKTFEPNGFNPFKLFLAALPATILAYLCFWIL